MSRRFINMDCYRLGTVNNVTCATSTVSAASSAFGTQTYAIRVVSPSACFFRIGDPALTPTAVVTDAYLPPNWETFVLVTPGQKIGVITSTGTPLVSVVELTQ
jgi:hypothetical protein